MLQQGSFTRCIFRKLMLSNVLGWGAYCANLAIDAILGGSQLGELALNAISIITPLTSIIYFLMLLTSPGFAMLYGKYTGELDTDHARRAAGESLVSAAGMSVIIALLLFIIKEPYLAYFNCTGELYENASVYYNWIIVYGVICPVLMSLNYLVVADGDAFSALLANLLSLGSNIIFSIFLSKRYGISGLGLATVIGSLMCTLGFAFHFFRKSNGVHFRLCFCRKEFFNAVRLSSSFYATYIFRTVVSMILNKLIIITSGVSYISAFSVVNLAICFFEMSGAVNDSSEGLFLTYLGEQNNYGIHNVMKTASRATLLLGIALTVLLFLSAPFLPRLYGMTSPELITASLRATRIIALAAISFSFCEFGKSLYPALEKPGTSILLAALHDLACPLLLAVPLGLAFGFTGIVVGITCSPWLVLILFSLILRVKYGKSGFPLYLPDSGEEVLSFDLKVEPVSFIELQGRVSDAMLRRGYSLNHIENLIEELYLRIMDKNPGKTILSELTLFFGPSQMRMIIRDNGIIFALTDEESPIDSFNAFVLNSLLETKNKSYVMTTSLNRNAFVFVQNRAS